MVIVGNLLADSGGSMASLGGSGELKVADLGTLGGWVEMGEGGSGPKWW